MAHRRLLLVALAALLLVPALALAAKKETHAQVQRRLATSPALWATVNFCDTKHHPNALGVRVSMPGTFANGKELMYARVRVQYFSTVKHHRGWQNVAGSRTRWFLLGGATKAARQAGVTFRYDPQGFRFRALTAFQWRYHGKVRYFASKLTSAGHRDAAGGDPPGHSAVTCVIKR